MAAKPYRFIDRRGSGGGGTNQLFRGAIQTDQRKFLWWLDNDTHQNISDLGRRQLLTHGRWLFANLSIVRGALLEIAEFSSSFFEPRYIGADPTWGDTAEEWLYQHDRICDVRSWPYNMRTYRLNLLLECLRGGDMGTALVQTPDGYPQIQAIPGHRIFGNGRAGIVETGPNEGATIIDGVICNSYGAPIAYRVKTPRQTDDPNEPPYTDIPARDMFLSFIPFFPDQLRGISHLAAGTFDWQDVAEARQFELIAQKAAAAISLVENNEDGEPPPGSDAISYPTAGQITTKQPTGLITESLDGGIIRYIKAKSGGKIEFPSADRPTANQADFEERIVRSALHGLPWSADFSLDPSNVGGAPFRIIVEKINRIIKSFQDLLLEPAARRIDAFRMAKAAKLGLLPELPADWYQIEYQGPAKFSADAGYDDQVDRERVKLGGMSYREWYSKRGLDWKHEIRQRIREQAFIETESAKEKVDPNKVQMLTNSAGGGLRQDANGTPGNNQTTQP